MAETSLARYFQQSTRRANLTPLSVANTGSEQVGLAVAGLGNAVDQIAQREEQFWVQKEMSDIDGYSRDLWDTSINNATDGAAGFEQSYLGGLDERYNIARQNAPTNRALRALETEILNHRNQQAAVANGFATQEKYEFRRDTILQEVDNFSQEVYRLPGIEPYQPTHGLAAPGLPGGIMPSDPESYYSSGMAHPHTGEPLENNLDTWSSRYYSPRDFADGANMSDRSGGVMVATGVVAALDWVTDQFGYGKLQINSGYRSPESNVARANSGEDGPHTHGEAFDVQVRGLAQGEKNRLYSLFRAAGFNAFGFGEGVLHVEKRAGDGATWTYGGTSEYSLVPVVGPQALSGDAGTGEWGAINQYPYLPIVGLTAVQETGSHDLASASIAVSQEADGSTSYGILGLNSSGMLQTFVGEFGSDFGLSAPLNSPEFAGQWISAVQSDPEGFIRAQLQFHERHIVRPAQRALVAAGATAVVNDPRVMAFAADTLTQYGPELGRRHLEAAAGAVDAATFINVASESMRRSLDSDFATALGNDAGLRTGLTSRIDNRARDAMSINAGTTSVTGNVPAWDGPIPEIDDWPGFSDRMRRIEGMVETMGGTPDQRRDLLNQMRATVTRAWLTRVAEVNPPAAMAALMSGRYDEALTLTDTHALVGGTRSAYAQFEAEIRESQRELISNLKTEAEILLADELASVASTGQSLGRLTDSHLAVLSDKNKSDLAFARFMYETDRTVSNASNDELPAILEDLEPSGDGFAEEQRRYQYARDLIDKRIEAQTNDPAGYAIGTSEQLASLWDAAIRSGDPQQVSTAISAIQAAQRRAGVPEANIRSIPQASMTQNEALLSNAETPDAAFASFMELRGLFGSAFGDVIGDMESAGLASGWAEVNELVDGGNVLLAKSLARVVHADAFSGDAELGVNLAKAGQPEIARMIFDGRVRREEVPNLLPTGRDDDFDMNSNQIIGSYLGDSLQQSPALMQSVRQAALSIYANGAILGEALDGVKLEEAIDMAAGGVLEHNATGFTGKFIAPVAGMSQTQFDEIARRIEDEDLEGAFVGYSNVPAPVTARMLLRDMQFVSSGNGRYFLKYPGSGLARDEDGNPFELDILGLMPTLADRQAVTDERWQEFQNNITSGTGVFAPGGLLDNFDPETGEWTAPE